MTKWNNTLPSMMKVAFGFPDITLVTVEKDTKKHEVRFLKLKKLLLTDYSVQLQLILLDAICSGLIPPDVGFDIKSVSFNMDLTRISA